MRTTHVRWLGIIGSAVIGCSVAVAAPPADAGSASLRTLMAQHLQDPSRYSAGVRNWLNPPRSPGADTRTAATAHFGTNVDANDPSQDVAGGQSETAIAAQRSTSGRELVLAAWNDASGFLGAPTTKQGSLTGVGISQDGGRSFSDLHGLPNNDTDQQWYGDPTVTSLGDGSHFIVGSMYWPSVAACSDGLPSYATVAVAVATVRSTRSGPSVRFSAPIEVARPGNVCRLQGDRPPPNLAILDKDWVSYDPSSRTLAVSFTRFYLISGFDCSPSGCRPLGHSGNGQIEIVRAHVPSDPATLAGTTFGKPVVVWPEEPFCPAGTASSEIAKCGAENEGAYVAVAPGGDTYVAWERNLDTNFFNGDPYVYEHAAMLRPGASTVTRGGVAAPVVLTAGRPGNRYGGVRSLDSTVLAGYSRGTGNDFPRVSIDRAAKQVVFVWNDASLHPLGNIWMRTAPFGLTGLGAVHRVDDGTDYALRFMPAVSVRSGGVICTSWYDRSRFGATSTKTDYVAECRPSSQVNGTDVRITTGPTDWAGTSSLIIPNFGDYTDNASDGGTTFFTWSDGRVGVPQPFVDSR